MNSINLRSKELREIIRSFESESHMDEAGVVEVLSEAFINAYRKEIDSPEAEVRVDITPEGVLSVYHDLDVVENDKDIIDGKDFLDDTLDIRLKDAQAVDKKYQVGDKFTQQVELDSIGRGAVTQAKNLLKQKVKEQEKERIYNEFKDKVSELVTGTIKTIDPRSIFIDLNNSAMCIMKNADQIPGERYREGTSIKAIIKSVSKESKGSQVVLSRSDPMFIRRLFEREVPEIAQGVVEIKAIARVAGDRTKLVVYSKDEDVDPIGACIGPHGSRIQAIIGEVHGEKVDVFKWSDDLVEMVKIALHPAEVTAVFYAEIDEERFTPEQIEKQIKYNRRPLVVVVGDDQLSAAIGKEGKNVKRAVKLIERKIDIKTQAQILEDGIDMNAKIEEFVIDQERLAKEKEERELLLQQEEMERRKKEFEASVAQSEESLEDKDSELVEIAIEEEPAIEEVVTVEEEAVESEVVEEKAEELEAEPEVEVVKETKKKKELTPKTGYVSKFEEFADASNREEEQVEKKKRRKKKDDDERRLRPEELDTDKEYEIKPEYTEEELEEIARAQEEEEADSWINDDDIDFDEYDEYYDDDEGRR